jgi:hypothetical protein
MSEVPPLTDALRPLPLPPELAALGRIRALPVLHGRMECAWAARRVVEEILPSCVVVELPTRVGDAFARGVARLPRLSVLQLGSADSTRLPRYLLVEPTEPLVEAFRSARALGIPVAFGDLDLDEVPARREAWPDPFAATRLGYARYVGMLLDALDPSEEDTDRARENAMAFAARQALIEHGGEILLVCGIAHVPGLLALSEPVAPPLALPRPAARVLNLHPDSAREVLSEMPFLQMAWEKARDPTHFEAPPPREEELPPEGEGSVLAFPGRSATRPPPSRPPLLRETPPPEPENGVLPERTRVHLELCRAASARSEREEKAPLTPLQMQVLLQYARNLAIHENQLQPGVFDLLLAARGVADDNFAWWFWQEATDWPYQSEKAEIGTLRVGLEELHRGRRVFRFHRRERTEGLIRRILRPRPREARPGEWKDLAGPHHCSHPPEDIALEGYAAFLRKRTTGILSAEQSRVEPFTTSILDGIDMRETLRNMAHDGRIYVREERPVRGRVGSVVLIFDEDEADRAYPYRMTWQGEHAEESDMAFYSTPPGARMVGPGISRCEYGGFLMTWPPLRMYAVWEDEVLAAFPRKHERLAVAGILYSQERIVTFIAAHPPRPMLRAIAERFDRRLVYLPLGQLSPITLKRIRTFHILHGKWVRSMAETFIR